jgi:hypothetical protein
MKIVELLNHVAIALNNEEADVLAQFESKERIAKRDLNEREIVVANQLVNKDILLRRKNNGKIEYSKKIHSVQTSDA